ncbi:MAG: hypothetical protein K5765_05675 [Clostridia bacterium]|nr:hypothetical protein [Clostridia bacterium]
MKLRIKVFLTTIIMILCLAALCACGLTGSNPSTSGKGDSGKKEPQQNELKKDLNLLTEAFNDSLYRENDVNFSFQVDGFFRTTLESQCGPMGFKIDSILKKIKDSDKEIFSLNQESDKDANYIVFMFNELKKSLESAAESEQDDSVLSFLATYNIQNLLSFLTNFLDGYAKTNVDIGRYNDLYNIISLYDSTKEEIEDVGKWYLLQSFADNTFGLLKGNVSLAVATLLFENSYEHFVNNTLIYEKETGKQRLDDKGKAEYKYEINKDKVVDYEFYKLLKIFDIDKETIDAFMDEEGTYDKLMSFAKALITVEEANVNAEATNNEVINKLNTKLTIKFTATYNEGKAADDNISTILDFLKDKGILKKEVVGRIRQITKELFKYITDENNDKSRMELTINLDFKQSFKVGKKNIDISEYDERLFYGIDVPGQDTTDREDLKIISSDQEQSASKENDNKEDIVDNNQQNDGDNKEIIENDEGITDQENGNN